MSWDEHIMLIAHTCVSFGSRVAVIGNTGSNATREAVHATCQGFAVGMAVRARPRVRPSTSHQTPKKMH